MAKRKSKKKAKNNYLYVGAAVAVIGAAVLIPALNSGKEITSDTGETDIITTEILDTTAVASTTPPNEHETNAQPSPIETATPPETVATSETETPDLTFPKDIAPVPFNGKDYNAKSLRINFNLPDGWTTSEHDLTLTIESPNDDHIIFNLNTNFQYSSSAELERELGTSDDLDTAATDTYLIGGENCMRVDMIYGDVYNLITDQSIIYIPSKNIHAVAAGTDWKTLNAVIQSIK